MKSRPLVLLLGLGLGLALSFGASAFAGCSASERDSNVVKSSLDGGIPEGAIVDPSIGTDDAQARDAGCTQLIDIVFVMDVSSSMDAFLDKLAQEMEAVDAALKAISPTASPYYGLAVFVDDAKLLNKGLPFQNAAALKGEFSQWAKFTFLNKQIDSTGSNSTWPENSLDALYAAASNFSWREGSLRIVLHTTDDTFWNGPTTQDGMSIAHGYQETVQKLQAQQVRVFSFASKFGGPSETTDVSMGWFGPYQGQDAIPKATFGGVFELAQVVSGQTSLAKSIEGLVTSTLCKPYSELN